MAEGSEVFVAEDSQADHISVPGRKKQTWARVGQKFLFLLVGLNMVGFLVERWLIYNLHEKLENTCSHPESSQQVDFTSPAGPTESTAVPTSWPHLDQDRQRPFAHLIASSTSVLGDGSLIWMSDDAASIIHNMRLDSGRLSVETDGFYFIYSKVMINAAEECLLIKHKVMKARFPQIPVELMRSESFRCRHSNPSGMSSSGDKDPHNSFLAGIFYLQRGEEIHVTVDDKEKLFPGRNNFMGAFMISP